MLCVGFSVLFLRMRFFGRYRQKCVSLRSSNKPRVYAHASHASRTGIHLSCVLLYVQNASNFFCSIPCFSVCQALYHCLIILILRMSYFMYKMT